MTKVNNQVTKFLDDLNHPLRSEIEQLRLTILGANTKLTENIKWNGPNYCMDNNDRITMRIHPLEQLQLIFHRGAKVKEQPKDKLIEDKSGLLSWKGNDRAVATFKTMADIEARKSDLPKVVNNWITATS
jgi:uncharacterized protein YdeI (YjbR/CyaY-like superfamily)